MTRLRIVSILCAAFAAPMFGQTNPPVRPGDASATPAALTSFAKEAAVGGMSEVELGRLAVQKGTNPAVKEFGQRMVDDHSKANQDLRAAASQSGVTLPSEIDAKQKKAYDKLSALSGAAFDRAYMSDMVKDHKEDIALFEKASREAGESPIKKFAADELPTLREHLQMAEKAQKNLDSAVVIPPSER